MNPLLSIRKLTKTYRTGKHEIHAVKNVSLDINPGEIVGLAGQSGCGKTTLGKMLVRLLFPTAGEVFYRDTNILNLNAKDMQKMRRHMQIILQDPYGALNPHLSVEQIIAEGLHIHGIRTNEKVEKAMDDVRLPLELLKKKPSELSGGGKYA